MKTSLSASAVLVLIASICGQANAANTITGAGPTTAIQGANGSWNVGSSYVAPGNYNAPVGVQGSALPNTQYIASNLKAVVAPSKPNLSGYKFATWNSSANKIEMISGAALPTTMPTNGKAAYNGVVEGKIDRLNAPSKSVAAGDRISGNVVINADFSKKTIDITMNNFTDTTRNTSANVLGTVAGTGKISGSQFSGDIGGYGNTGALNGKFLGAGAQEVVGGATINNRQLNATVTFAAKK